MSLGQLTAGILVSSLDNSSQGSVLRHAHATRLLPLTLRRTSGTMAGSANR